MCVEGLHGSAHSELSVGVNNNKLGLWGTGAVYCRLNGWAIATSQALLAYASSKERFFRAQINNLPFILSSKSRECSSPFMAACIPVNIPPKSILYLWKSPESTCEVCVGGPTQLNTWLLHDIGGQNPVHSHLSVGLWWFSGPTYCSNHGAQSMTDACLFRNTKNMHSCGKQISKVSKSHGSDSKKHLSPPGLAITYLCV